MYFSFIKFALCLCVITGSISSVFGQWSLSQLNLNHQHDPESELFAKVYGELKGDSVYITFNFTINKPDATLEDYYFDIFLEKSVNGKLTQPLLKTEIDSALQYAFNNEASILFKTPYNGEKYVILRVLSTYSNYSLYFENVISQSPSIKIYNKNKAIYNQYISPGLITSQQDLFGFFYKQDFDPAVAPMITSSNLPSKELTLDSTFVWQQEETLNLKNTGLYLFQADTSSGKGKAFRVENRYFPKLATLDQLIDPLIYITTQEEYADLSITPDKVSFDKFWLSRSDSPGKAKELIREYYNRVEATNKFYTSYKKGWKTDMGMIYIIFGPPDEVIKTSQGENWIYLSDYRFPKITFEFIKSDSIFSSSHYVLIRKKNYDAIWIRAVELWRRGKL